MRTRADADSDPELYRYTPGRGDPVWLDRYRRLARPVLDRLWPVTFSGTEHLPRHDDYLIVANHSGLGVVESVALVGAWMEHVGEHRPLAAMAHSALFQWPGVRDLLRAVGAVEATPEAARTARNAGAALLLFPGGDQEAMRPIWRAREVDFRGRHGWIRLAREHRLTIVPLAITGSHVTLPNLGYSRALAAITGARWFGVRQIPLPLLSIVGAAATLAATRGRRPATRAALAGLAYGLGAHVPFIPSRIGMHLLEPLSIDAPVLDDAAIYERVTSAIAAVLSRA